MTNPFTRLGNQSQDKLAMPHLEPAQTQLPVAPWMKAAEPYDELVTSVLQQLLEAAYPAYGLRNHRAKNKHRHCSQLDNSPAWSLGYYFMDHFSETGRSESQVRWNPCVAVTLIFSAGDHPVSLECARGGRILRCGLSQSELVAALSALH